MIERFRQGAPAELWQSMVREGAERAGCTLDEDCESHLVFVLLRYQREPHVLTRTQALDWLEAQQRVGSARAEALRDVGDRCLIVAGLFPGLAKRRRVSVDYFVDLGRGAYQAVGDAGRSAQAQLFAHLADLYRDLVHVLSSLRDATRPRDLRTFAADDIRFG
ncbi:MAG TPA: hypothetical protein VGC30_01010 [Dokdonella sp.]